MATTNARMRPSWMTDVTEMNDLPLRFMTPEICEQVDDLVELRHIMYSQERSKWMENFLKEEIDNVADIISMSFITDEDEVRVFTDFRAAAVRVEEEIYNRMYGTGKYGGEPRFPEYRWTLFADILHRVRDFSVVLGSCEVDDEDKGIVYRAIDSEPVVMDAEIVETEDLDSDGVDESCEDIWQTVEPVGVLAEE